tara:strand:- start:1376 stop:1681 length:306 start_codon:yes stop_codon:yes gene_type:complete
MKKTLNKINALNDRIFLTKDIITETGGIILPAYGKDEHNAPPYTGTVISVGPKITDPDIAVGARLLWHDLAGFNIDMDGEKIYSIREQDVVAIVEKNSEIL